MLNRLLPLCDEKYKQFHSKLMPTIDANLILGIRTPELRKLVKAITEDEAKAFMNNLPHKYYEENNLHGFLIEKIKDYDSCIIELERFLPYIDNWATCDGVTPKVLKKDLDKTLTCINKWIKSEDIYTVRYAIKLLMCFYLDDAFDKKYLEIVCNVKSDEYYINMMIAWYFATAMAKQYDSAISYITEYKLSPWVHNKTIQKCVESYRITEEQKEFLKGYRVK